VDGVHANVATYLNKLASLLEARGPPHYTEAETMFRRALSIEETLHDYSLCRHPSIAHNLLDLGYLLCKQLLSPKSPRQYERNVVSIFSFSTLLSIDLQEHDAFKRIFMC
jgi:hypothetical protein